MSRIGADQVAPPGPGVPITIVDSGADPTNPELAGRPNTSFLNDQTVTGAGEFHGTAVASVAAAPENGVGIVGVYPQAVLQNWDASPVSDLVDLNAADGIAAAAQHCPGVINLSFSGTSGDAVLEDAILRAVHNGCLVVASSGNNGLLGNVPTYPASYPHVLTVGATDETDNVASFSSMSAWLDLAAPGVDIVAAVPLSYAPSGYLTGLSGTSFSAPLVSAAAAWVWTVRPTLDPEEPNDNVDQVKPGRRFTDGEPALTTAAQPSGRIFAHVDENEDPRDVYRIWVPTHRVVRVKILTGATDAAARIWGPRTFGVDEGIVSRRRDLKGPLIHGAAKGFEAYVEVLLTGRTREADYVLDVTASRR